MLTKSLLLAFTKNWKWKLHVSMRWEISEKREKAIEWRKENEKINKLISFDLKCYKISHESIASDQRVNG